MQTRTTRALIGCGIGCGVMLLVAIGAGILFVIWLRQPGALLEPGRLLHADTTGYLEWTLREEDPGTLAMAESLIQASQQLPDEFDSAIPSVLSPWLVQFQNRRNERAIREMLPMVVAWSQRPGAIPGENEQLFTLSLEKFGNRMALADWILGLLIGRSPESSTESHEGESIYRLGDGRRAFVFFIREGTVFFASDLEAARRLIDHLESPGPATRAPTGLERLLAGTPAQSALRGAIANRDGEWSGLWRSASAALAEGGIAGPWDGLSGVTVHGGFTQERAFAGALQFFYDDESRAAASLPPLVSALNSIQEAAGLQLQIEGATQGDHVELAIRIPDLPGQMDAWLRGQASINRREVPPRARSGRP